MRYRYLYLCVATLLIGACGDSTVSSSETYSTENAAGIVQSQIQDTVPTVGVTDADATTGNRRACWEFAQPFDPSSGTGDDIGDSAGRMTALANNSTGTLNQLFNEASRSIVAVGPYYANDEMPPKSMVDLINAYSDAISHFCAAIQGYFSTTTVNPDGDLSGKRRNTNVACSKGGACDVGDIGPGGGIVIRSLSEPESWGQFIEAAPNGWYDGGSDPAAVWCETQLFESVLHSAFSSSLGAGKENTKALASRCTEGALKMVSDYEGGGKDDWYLPSGRELEDFTGLSINSDGSVGFSKKLLELNSDTSPLTDSFPFYWSSTSNPSCVCAVARVPGSHGASTEYGHVGLDSPDVFYVRPVRSFF